jgi:hypothetical protein
MTDPDVAAAEQHAARELARRLAGVTSLRDVDAAATDYVAWLREQGWRPPLGGPSPLARGRPDPEAAHRGAQRAREALGLTVDRPEETR